MVSRVSTLVALLGLVALAHATDNTTADDDSGQLESICSSDDSKSCRCFETTDTAKYAKSKAVARLKIDRLYCTGWLFGSEGHLMTNHHCVKSAADAAKMRVEFKSETEWCYDHSFQGGFPGVV
ncbi:hypothetical protein As57867_006077, partial [Aphanomyces stellatus]